MIGKILSFLTALILGCFTEGLLDGFAALFGNGGPCGFGVVSLVVGLWHLPGMIVSSPLWILSRPDGRDIYGYAALAVTYVVGALIFTVLYYILIRAVTRAFSSFSHEHPAA
jgi:hypothetical protein